MYVVDGQGNEDVSRTGSIIFRASCGGRIAFRRTAGPANGQLALAAGLSGRHGAHAAEVIAVK